MLGGLGLRFSLEVAFLVAAAVIAALLELGWPAIVALMSVAWIATTAIEWRFSRVRASAQAPGRLPAAAPTGEWIAVRETRREDESQLETEWVEDEKRLPPVRAAEPEIPVHVRVLPRSAAEKLEPAGAKEPEPAAEEVLEPAAEEVLEPAAEEVLEPAAAAPEPEAEPEAESEAEPEVAVVEEPAPLVAVPPPPPEPIIVEPPPPAPEPDRVVAFPAAAFARQRWNVWELERLTRARAGADPVRDEELGFLLVYLRDFALADGSLPEEFDELVRESFGDVMGAAANR